MLALVLALAAAAPPGDLHPVLAPADAPTQFAAHMARLGGSDALACEPFWPEDAQLCWRRADGHWVTTRDLRTWEVSPAELRAAAEQHMDSAASDGWDRQSVDGVEGAYWTAGGEPGWEQAWVLTPERILATLGVDEVFVSAPADRVLLAWAPGNPELDQIVAVGARKMFDELPGGASAVVYRFRDGAWTAFAEAQPREE